MKNKDFLSGSLGKSRENALEEYANNKEALEKITTGKEFLNKIQNLASLKVTQKDIDVGSVSALDRKRQKLQIDLFRLADTMPQVFKADYDKEIVDYIKSKIISAGSKTVVTGRGEELELNPKNRGNIYNILAGAYEKLDEAVIVSKFLIKTHDMIEQQNKPNMN